MEAIEAILASARDAWRALALGPFEQALVKVALVTLAIYLIVLAAERLSGTRTTNYRSGAFAQDLAYWFYYRTGVHDLLFMATIVLALEKPLAGVSLHLFTGWPFFAQFVAYLVIGDFIAYWIHRAEHRFRFMWAFHTTHHSQERLNFATIARFHPVEMVYHNLLAYIPMRAMGAEPLAWFPAYLALQLFTAVQHTQIPWKLGPLYRVIATPHFHSFHHSTDPAHHDRNFANLFSIWDHLFGTAVPAGSSRPVRMGLPDMPRPTFIGTLVTPFILLHALYIAPAAAKAAEADAEASAPKQ